MSLFFIADINVGLDQQLTMATDSYVYKYFKLMTELLSMGPPVYWVLGTKLPMNDIANQDLICSGLGCNKDSVVTKLYLASKYPAMYAYQHISLSSQAIFKTSSIKNGFY